MINVVIGTEENQFVPQKILEYSIHQHSNSELDIRSITQQENRIGGTKFGFVRFHVPSIFDYQGKAIYLDADQVVLADLQELLDTLDSNHLLGLVENLVGFFGDKPVPKRKETSVMVLNCDQLKDWQPETLFNNVVPNDSVLEPGQIQYRDFMWVKWIDDDKIQQIDSSWNHFNVLRKDTKLVHFSHVASQPWKNPDHPLTEFWSQWLVATLESGFLEVKDLRHAIRKKHLHPYFRKYCPRKRFFFI